MSDHDTKIPMLDKAAELDAAQRAGLITKSRAAGLLAEFAELDVLAEEIQAAYKAYRIANARQDAVRRVALSGEMK